MSKYQIKISQDNDASSPREWDNLGTMVCWHSKYNLGDENALTELDGLICDSGTDTDYFSPGDYLSWLESKNYVVLPLYLYDHSGITISTTSFSCPWDSGQIGFIYVSREKIRSEYGVKRVSKKKIETICGYLKSEVETYDQYLRGDVFGYQLQKVDDCGCVLDELDSCFGFYGDDIKTNGMLEHIPSEHHNAEVVLPY